MGKRYDNYEKAAKAEAEAKKAWRQNPTSENQAKAMFAEDEANKKWDHLMEDPRGD